MNIAFFIDHLSSGGAERVVQTLANYFQSQGNHQVYIFVLADTPSPYPLQSGVQKIVLTGKRKKDLSSILAKDIHIFSFHAYWNAYTYVLADALADLGNKVILTEHNAFFTLYQANPAQAFISKRLETWRKISVLTVLSSYDYQIHGSILNNVVYMPNPNPFALDTYVNLEKGKNIIAVARLSPAKAIDKLLRVFALVAQKHSDWHLFIVGDGALRADLEKLAQDLGVYSQVTFTGNVHDVEKYYAKASIHVMTSVREGMPMALLEAKKYAMPSVVMHLPCFYDLIENNIDGFVLAQDDITAMADKIIFLIENPKICSDMGKNVMQSVQQYDLAVIGKRWELLFEFISNTPKANLLEILKNTYMPTKTYPADEILSDFSGQYNALYKTTSSFSPYKRLESFAVFKVLFAVVDCLRNWKTRA
jgi:GalNAc-alpha-(1->4)-GalNAc-alpha-(1->3)-diNAcBac-PP-undecaprenol alpha-1,4-N-acetyl-D-galactosaminyltransferase